MVKGCLDKWGTCSRVVPFDHPPEALACHKEIVVVGLSSGDIVTLDTITGTRGSIFSGHTDGVTSLAFSLDGKSLVSGSKDNTVKLWDIQTGGVIKTFHSSSHRPHSVSISPDPDAIMIASGSHNNAICLWDTQTGKCRNVIEQCFTGQEGRAVTCVNFETPRRLMAASEAGLVQQFDIDGSAVGSLTLGDHIAFSSDGSRFVLSEGRSPIVRNSGSGTTVSFLPPTNRNLDRYCLSACGKFVVGVSNATAYVWDVTNPTARVVETFALHGSNISSLVFSSCLISASSDKSVRFWEVGGSSPNQVTMKKRPATHASAGVTFIILQAEERTVITIDSDGVVGLWNLLTGLHKVFRTFETDGGYVSDARLVNGVLTVAFCGLDSSNTWKIATWNVENEEHLQTVALPPNIHVLGRDLRISGDGTRAFGPDTRNIQTWSTSTGRSTGAISFERPLDSNSPSFIVDGSRVWIRSENSPAQGWDLRNPRSPPLSSPSMPSDKRHLDFIQVDDINGSDNGSTRVEKAITRKEVFRLPERFSQPSVAQWDGQYLVAAYSETGELLILDFAHMIPR